MGVQVIDSSLDNQDFMAGLVLRDEPLRRTEKGDIDARRKLEDKLEEMRLQKELREFDFDI